MISNKEHNKIIGSLGEKKATRFLRRKGYRILERNRHESHSEIDIISSNRKYIVFVEVKTRCVGEDSLAIFQGTAASAVNSKKQSMLISGAKRYLSRNRAKVKDRQPRFDVIEVYLTQSKKVLSINHIENAFWL